jgi:hypothetical protein
MATLNTDINRYSTDLNNFLGGYTGTRQSFYGGQKTEGDDWLTRFRQGLGGQEALPVLNQRISEELGLPQLRQNYGQLQTTLQNIPYTFGEATKGFDVNANQLERTIGQKSSELAPVVNAVGNRLTSAEGELSNRMGIEQAERERLMTPFTYEREFMVDRWARENTGFTTEMESKLTGYLQKLSLGVQLSTVEYQELQAYARAELDYKKAIETAKINAEAERYKIDNQSKYSAMPTGSSALYNTQTGKMTGWT